MEIRLKKADPEQVSSIAHKHNIEPEKARIMMRYSCWTVKQFADLTGRTVSLINRELNYGSVKGGVMSPSLNACYPFEDKDGNGPKFVLRDEKSEEFLKKHL